MGGFTDYVEAFSALSAEDQAAVKQLVAAGTKGMRWIPNPGPQTEAFDCEADELLYGGQAGGGKTELIIGLSLTSHQESLVLRRTHAEADKLFDRYAAIIGHENGANRQKGWKIDGRNIEIGGVQLEKDKQKRKGVGKDLICFDELVDFTESQYVFISTWNRTTIPGQRCRVVSTTNPPTTPEGMWVIKRWAAWLDPKHPKPAKSGEIRWYVNISGQEQEVEGRGPYYDEGRQVLAKSRCFIRSTLEDNPDLAATDYGATLDSLPPEMRAAFRDGHFDAGLKDQPFQLIPTEWIRLAQKRWEEHPHPPNGVPMCAIGVDVSGGGSDPMMMAPRYDGWYPALIEIPAKSIPADSPGKFAAGQVIMIRRNQAIVVVDMGGGYGGSCYEQLKENLINAQAYKGAEKSVRRTNDGQLKFSNKRTEALWTFREALDPTQPGGSPIMLPPDQMLLADLATPTFKPERGELVAESKEDVCARLGRSPDRGDAVIMAWSAGPTYVTDGSIWQQAYAEEQGARHGMQKQAIMGRQGRRNR